MTNKPYGYVYRITNKLNGKTYIGQRKLSYDRSWRHYLGSGKLLRLSIEKYGREHFTKSLVHYAWDKSELNILEDTEIQAEWDRGKGEYNLRRAGDFNRNPYANKTEAEMEIYRSRIRASISGKKSTVLKTRAVRQAYFNEEILPRILESSYSFIREAAMDFPGHLNDIVTHAGLKTESIDLLNRALIYDLYTVQGYSANDIGKMFGRTGQTVRNLMREMNLEIRKERHPSPHTILTNSRNLV